MDKLYLVSFFFVLFGMPLILTVLTAVIRKKSREHQVKYTFLTMLIGGFIGCLILATILSVPLLWILPVSVIGAIVLAGFGPGYQLMINDARKSLGLMKESERKSEEERIANDIKGLFHRKNKSKD